MAAKVVSIRAPESCSPLAIGASGLKAHAEITTAVIMNRIRVEMYRTRKNLFRVSRVYRVSAEFSSQQALYLAALGRRDEALEMIAGVEAAQSYSENLILVHMLLGDQEAADRMAAEIDALPLASLRFQDLLYYTNWRFPFHIEAAPNFRARLLEAGFTPAEIEARLHPAVKATDSP